MTPEKIIANIENYISTLTPTEQTMYKECLEVTESSYKPARVILKRKRKRIQKVNRLCSVQKVGSNYR